MGLLFATDLSLKNNLFKYSTSTVDMPSYNPTTQGWPDNLKPVDRAYIKRLVNTNQWTALGTIFSFTPVYHSGFQNFIDWRCVPESLMLALRGKTSTEPQLKRPAVYGPKRPKPYTVHRLELYDNQGGVCHYCKKRVATRYEWSIDHRLPYARGGTNVAQNRIGCCKPCNGNKGPLTEEEFLALNPGVPGIEDRCKNAINSSYQFKYSTLTIGSSTTCH